tara:strand:- start:636 stop:1322 length:687 start_codon:yes stop_codon:yes gene_type:complete
MSGSRYINNFEKVDMSVDYNLDDAIEMLKNFKSTKFDETVDLAVNLGIDPRHADQSIRGTVSMPNGTGKEVKILVVTKDKVDEAKEAGADFFGSDDMLEKIKGGWTDVDVIIATPDMMPELGKLGRVLGPRGLMPNPKTGTVTNDIKKAVVEVKSGKIEYRADKNGVVHAGVAKLSFENNQIKENIDTFISKILKVRPSSVKGTYMKKVTLSSTMSPGIRLSNDQFNK